MRRVEQDQQDWLSAPGWGQGQPKLVRLRKYRRSATSRATCSGLWGLHIHFSDTCSSKAQIQASESLDSDRRPPPEKKSPMPWAKKELLLASLD